MMMKANILRKGMMLVGALTLSFSIAHATDWLEKGGVGKQDPSEPSLQMPLHFVAGYTQFLDDCEDDDIKIVTPVSCGVYGISTDGGTVYTLRYIDGGTIGGKNAWKVHDFTRIPRMEKEGLIMYKNDDTRQLYLIKPTGAVEALPKKYVDATNFVDGIAAVATATSGLGFFLSWTFIDRSLKPFAPGVVTQPRQFGKNQSTIAPLRGGMRAVYVPDESGFGGSWGFMNGLGKIVIKPQYRKVRSFSDGMALVVEENGDFYFIDVTGRKCFEPRKVDENIFPEGVSDYDGGLCTIAPMGIGDNFYARYYTTSGKLSGVALWGSALHNGKGYMRFIDKAENQEVPSVLIIQPSVDGYDDTKGMRTEADFHTAMWGTPWYDEADVAHFSETQTSAVGVGSQYCFPWTIGAFSTDGYAPATIVSPNGNVTFEGIIDRQGQFRVVYKVY